MKVGILAALILITSTAARSEWKKPTWQETTLMVGAGALCIVDTLTTIDAGRRGYTERNLLLGRTPSTERIYITGAVGLISAVTLWYILPPPWRSIFTGGIIVIEGINVSRQFAIGLNMAL